jgi:hypothetical protein
MIKQRLCFTAAAFENISVVFGALICVEVTRYASIMFSARKECVALQANFAFGNYFTQR